MGKISLNNVFGQKRRDCGDALNHYPVVAAYFWQVQCAGSSTGLPPSIKVAECGALSGLIVSEMLNRSVEEED